MAQPWTEDDPGSVELGCMTNSASALTTASTHYWNAASSLGTTKTSVSEWSGAAAEAWRASLGTLVVDLGASRDRILDGKAAIMAYRSTTESISNRAATAKHNLKRAQAVYHEPQPNQVTDPVGFETWQNDRYMAGYHEQDARNEIYRLALERYAADDDAIRGLAAALPADWTNTLAALATVGITGVGDLTRDTNSDAMLELSQRISGGGAKPGDYAALALLLGMYENNQSMMSTLFTELGGEGTVHLVEAIGDWGVSDSAVAAAALALGVLVRSGLSTGSQGWLKEQADDFAESMFDVGNDEGDSIAYLFSDTVDSPLGNTLAVAAANEIDEFERLHGYQWLMDGAGGGLWLGIQEFGNDGNRMSDASGPIFSTLGHYPDSAYEWLTAGGNGDDRVDFWYHDRYDASWWVGNEHGNLPWYIKHDGFQGVADLWFGSQQAAGGPIYGAGDVANPQDSAELAWRVMHALITNDTFQSDNISDAASAHLAGGFLVNIAGLTAVTIAEPNDSTSHIVENNGVYVPSLTKEELAVFLARAGSQESGAEVLSWGIHSYQETLLNMAMSSPNSLDLGVALTRIVDLQAALDGTIAGQLIENAEAADAQREAIVSGVTFVLGAMPVPFIGDLLGEVAGTAASWALEYGQGLVTDGVLAIGSDGISDIWATQTEEVRANFDQLLNSDGGLNDQVKLTLLDSIYQYLADVDPSWVAGIPYGTGNLEQIFNDWVNRNETGASVFDYSQVGMIANTYDTGVTKWQSLVEHFDKYVEYEAVP